MTTQNAIPANALLDDLHPSRFLKVADLLERWKVQNITVTISRLTNEDTIPNPKDIDPDTNKPRVVVQPVLYFKNKPIIAKDGHAIDGGEFPRGYLLSAAVDVQSMKKATSAHTVGELTGKRIMISVDEFKHKAVLRIDPKPVTE